MRGRKKSKFMQKLDDAMKAKASDIPVKKLLQLPILRTDKVFTASPNAGDPDCICSRCSNVIPQEQSPFLRCWPGPGDLGYDPSVPGGTEYRFCWNCSKQLGIIFNPSGAYEADD